jgi:peptidoglycan/xylan/chitin deacetylase (PgdA/CDA1 family)
MSPRTLAKLAVLVAALPALALPLSASAKLPRRLVTVSISRPVFSPDGDGVKDATRIRVAVTVPATLSLAILGESRAPVLPLAVDLPVQPGRFDFVWDGRVAVGRRRRARDGRYSVWARVSDAVGETEAAQAGVVVDTQAPRVSWDGSPQRVPSRFLPLDVRVSDGSRRVRLELTLFDQTGARIARVRPGERSPGRVRLGWRPRPFGHALAPGAYRASARASDDAGNAATSPRRPLLVNASARPATVARFDGVGRRVALTFDDCGTRSGWSRVLAVLRAYAVKGTFFCPGRQVLASPDLARRTVRDGHAIGSHGWDHANFRGLSYESALTRLVNDREVWWRLTRASPTPFFRPPYGAYDRTVIAAAARAGYARIVLWEVDPSDWAQPGVGIIASRVLAHVRRGSIVLLHTTIQTAAALPSIIHGLRSRRLRPVTLTELEYAGTPRALGWPTL